MLRLRAAAVCCCSDIRKQISALNSSVGDCSVSLSSDRKGLLDSWTRRDGGQQRCSGPESLVVFREQKLHVIWYGKLTM